MEKNEKFVKSREKQGFSQAKLAKNAGLYTQLIQRIEYKEVKIGNLALKNAVALSHALGISVEDLLDMDS